MGSCEEDLHGYRSSLRAVSNYWKQWELENLWLMEMITRPGWRILKNKRTSLAGGRERLTAEINHKKRGEPSQDEE